MLAPPAGTGASPLLSTPLLSASTAAAVNESGNLTVGLLSVDIHPARALLGLLLSVFTGMTVFGNFLVIYAVVRQRYLRTITNYFIVSLATADLLMGVAVMPVAVVREVTQVSLWPFGRDLCDLWHALDVLSSTASIINLCLIALERYWATENPITYPTRMTKRRCCFMIAGGWVCSSAISFPAIIWWRQTDSPSPLECEFTTDAYYLIISSLVSFYAPLVIMVVVYYRIYRTATNLIRSFNAGAKVIYKNGSRGGEVMVLRIHRGRNPSPHHPPVLRTRSDGDDMAEEPPAAPAAPEPPDSSESPARSANLCRPLLPASPGVPADALSANKCITSKLRKFAVGRRLIKFNREQRAAKTLGIVMGIFIACWLPFFICNIVVAVDAQLIQPTVLGIVTWFGYINSSINPVIYAHSMRDFRRAFLKLLCSCYLRRQRRHRGFVLRSNCYNSNTFVSPNSSCRNPHYHAPPPVPEPSTVKARATSPTPASPGMETSFTSTSTVVTASSPYRVAVAAEGGGSAFNGYLTPAYTPTHRGRDGGKSEGTLEGFGVSLCE